MAYIMKPGKSKKKARRADFTGKSHFGGTVRTQKAKDLRSSRYVAKLADMYAVEALARTRNSKVLGYDELSGYPLSAPSAFPPSGPQPDAVIRKSRARGSGSGKYTRSQFAADLYRSGRRWL